MIAQQNGKHAKIAEPSGPKHARPNSEVSLLSPEHKAVIAAAAVVFAIGIGANVIPFGVPASAEHGVAYGGTVEKLEFDHRDVDGTVSDAELLPFDEIISDGAVIDEGAAYAIIESDAHYTDSVGEIFQDEVLRGGCEVVSLALCLQSMGLPVDPVLLADGYLVQDGSFANGYAGSPYTTGGGFPPGIVRASNLYLDNSGSSANAHDLTGTSFEGLCTLVSHGYPVMVWSTLSVQDPLWSNACEDDKYWYDNEHCVVMYGVTVDGVLVSDPIDGLVVRDTAEFARVYEACGCMAAAIY